VISPGSSDAGIWSSVTKYNLAWRSWALREEPAAERAVPKACDMRQLYSGLLLDTVWLISRGTRAISPVLTS
jgi:hypothetical protein